jgi:S-adenosylmethionine-dependent methyltransferase
MGHEGSRATDQDFDAVAEAFEGEIYGSSKGMVRLGVLQVDLLSAVPALGSGGLSVLDAGGGAGRLAVLLAEAGNRVILADPSREMLSRTERTASGPSGSLRTVRSSIQNLAEELDGERFDVVCCHAVLEWLADPEGAVGHLADFLGPEGRLSLMFYNRNAALLKRAQGPRRWPRRKCASGWTIWGCGCAPRPAYASSMTTCQRICDDPLGWGSY